MMGPYIIFLVELKNSLHGNSLICLSPIYISKMFKFYLPTKKKTIPSTSTVLLLSDLKLDLNKVQSTPLPLTIYNKMSHELYHIIHSLYSIAHTITHPI